MRAQTTKMLARKKFSKNMPNKACNDGFYCVLIFLNYLKIIIDFSAAITKPKKLEAITERFNFKTF